MKREKIDSAIAIICMILMGISMGCTSSKKMQQTNARQLALLQYEQTLQSQLCAGQINIEEYNDLVAAYTELNNIKTKCK